MEQTENIQSMVKSLQVAGGAKQCDMDHCESLFISFFIGWRRWRWWWVTGEWLQFRTKAALTQKDSSNVVRLRLKHGNCDRFGHGWWSVNLSWWPSQWAWNRATFLRQCWKKRWRLKQNVQSDLPHLRHSVLLLLWRNMLGIVYTLWLTCFLEHVCGRCCVSLTSTNNSDVTSGHIHRRTSRFILRSFICSLSSELFKAHKHQNTKFNIEQYYNPYQELQTRIDQTVKHLYTLKMSNQVKTCLHIIWTFLPRNVKNISSELNLMLA